jgi:hypothetical protein
MEKSPVFIHTQFRSGSTYLWNKFSENNDLFCFYEPFHERLSRMTIKYFKELNPTVATSKHMRHPKMRQPYFIEYRKFVSRNSTGIPFYKKEFAYDQFFNTENNPDLERYISSLIKGAESRRPLFKFTRSCMRTAWFKKNYPGSVNIYLYRNPRDQWHSAVDLNIRNKNPYFLAHDLMIAGKGSRNPMLAMLSCAVPLFEFNNDDYTKEDSYYTALIEGYSPEERYLIFYYVWLLALMENCIHADHVISINKLADDPKEREAFLKYLDSVHIGHDDFQDNDVQRYKSYSIPDEKLKAIEARVGRMVIGSLDPRKKELLDRKAASDERIRAIISEIPVDTAEILKEELPYYGSLASTETRFREMVSKVAEQAAELADQKTQEMMSVYSGYTYRVGNLMLLPVKKAWILLNKIRNRM